MTSGEIVLIVVSGLGVIHGLALALYLWIYPRGLQQANRLLSVLLLILSFRVGKSVILAFAASIDVKLIFTGLASLMAIGPLFYLFVNACVSKPEPLGGRALMQFVPSVLGIAFGLWLEEPHLESIPKWVFAAIFIGYYLHLLTYLVASYWLIRRSASFVGPEVKRLLHLFLYGLFIIWVAYVLNLFDETVPYVVGPVLYSIAAYAISFEVIRRGYMDKVHQTKYRTTSATAEQVDRVYERVSHLLDEESIFKKPDITLQSLSEQLKVSSQLLSMAINQRSGKNFNQFVNSYRTRYAAALLTSPDIQHQTIASIAFDSGFNSISSFNTAFKKEFGQTPQQYRSSLMK